MNEQTLRELKLAVGVVFDHFTRTTKQAGFSEEFNEKMAESYKRDRDEILSILNDQILLLQTAKEIEVQEAINWANEELSDSLRHQHVSKSGCLNTIIKALVAYQPSDKLQSITSKKRKRWNSRYNWEEETLIHRCGNCDYRLAKDDFPIPDYCPGCGRKLAKPK